MNAGVWSAEEHERYLVAMKLFGRNSRKIDWRSVANLVGTRSPRQVQTHHQKYISKCRRYSRNTKPTTVRREHRVDSEMMSAQAQPSISCLEVHDQRSLLDASTMQTANHIVDGNTWVGESLETENDAPRGRAKWELDGDQLSELLDTLVSAPNIHQSMATRQRIQIDHGQTPSHFVAILQDIDERIHSSNETENLFEVTNDSSALDHLLNGVRESATTAIAPAVDERVLDAGIEQFLQVADEMLKDAFFVVGQVAHDAGDLL